AARSGRTVEGALRSLLPCRQSRTGHAAGWNPEEFGPRPRPGYGAARLSRRATLERTAEEPSIKVTVDLDGTGAHAVKTPIGFLTHMVEQLARHGAIDLTVEAEGDTHIDGHHVTEDLAITLGKAVAEALGDKRGIRRYGAATLP